jgi:hypothetical protein
LFAAALGLQAPWYVSDIDFSLEKKRLDIHIDFERGSTLSYWANDKGSIVVSIFGILQMMVLMILRLKLVSMNWVKLPIN